MSDKEKEIIKKIAEGLPNLSEFDKGYFLGVVEAKADKRTQQAAEPSALVAKQEGGEGSGEISMDKDKRKP